jgi:hypothetical protein
MNTTFWSWGQAKYRLRDNAIPEIWNAQEQGWQLTNVLMGLIVGGDPTLDQITAEEVEAAFPGSTADDAKIIEITAYPFP